MLKSRLHHHAALDPYSLHRNILFVSLLCPDSAKHPTCFQEASHVRSPFTSVIRSTRVRSFTGTSDLLCLALLDTTR